MRTSWKLQRVLFGVIQNLADAVQSLGTAKACRAIL